MPSELWQRIRAARKYADLRQQDVADVCKVSRAAVAQWEYDDMARRTTPSIDQMKDVFGVTVLPATTARKAADEIRAYLQ